MTIELYEKENILKPTNYFNAALFAWHISLIKDAYCVHEGESNYCVNNARDNQPLFISPLFECIFLFLYV